MRGTVLAIGLSMLAGAGPVQAQDDVLSIPFISDIGSFDPDNGFEVRGISAINNVYEGLVEYAPGSTEIVGLLAESWTVSDDGLTYTFDLADNVRFHDGTPMDAAAVVTSLERRRGGNLILSYFLANVTAISAADPDTVVLTLGRPQPSLLDALASPWGPKVISPTALAEHDGGDLATTWLNEHAAGTGPFMLTEFSRGQRYVFTRNDSYWGEKPYFREIQISVVPDIGLQILQLQAGEIDAVPVNYPYAQLASLPPGLEVTSEPSMNQYDLFLKPGTALDDPAVRSAVLTAINPALWMTDAFGSHAVLSRSLYPNAMLDPVNPVVFPTDMDAAKAAIAAYGKVSLSIGMHSESATYRRIADLLIAQLNLIGVEATAYTLASGAAYALKGDPSAPDILLTIGGPDAAHPENQAAVFYTTGGILNYFGRSVPEADLLVEEAGTMTDITRRNALYEQAGQMYFDAGSAVPLVDADDVVVHRAGLTDLGLRPVYPPGNIDFATVRRIE